jgi:hypothetical protein
MITTRYIADTEEIVNTSWPNFEHDGEAAFQSLESSSLPPAWSGRTSLEDELKY